MNAGLGVQAVRPKGLVRTVPLLAAGLAANLAIPIAVLPATRLGQLVGELVRLTAPADTDFARLPARDAALGETFERVLSPEVRSRLAPLAARAAAEAPAAFDKLALALRETAERTALVICGDPAAALSIVAAECPGGLDRPEVARLARFAIGESYLGLR